MSGTGSESRDFYKNLDDVTFIYLAPVVQRVVNTIHWINHQIGQYVLSTLIHCLVVYPVANVIHPLNNSAVISEILVTLHKSLVAHQAGAYPGFHMMKRLGVFLLPPGWREAL